MATRDDKTQQAREEIEASLKDDPLARDILAVLRKHKAAERAHATAVAVRREGARQVAGADVVDAEAAEHLTLAEVARIRAAYKVAEAATPRVILEEDAKGRPANHIAADLGLSASYVSRFLREHKAAEQPKK
ncbi:hypothetical protein B7P34_04710 [Streptosporangium nondiastaticum]|uniref:Uncharacterized protein n=1 Tax=Streptosporangium nondiastaticum TaxID=35764 RepID=A0A9X7PJ76_9ACTN|nr:hypothetical protein [Streptosporangium nondiastaticum]PSJ29816.1 hypothetical protein B7P34_04710 [Streptosporangium nondiastaticum]